MTKTEMIDVISDAILNCKGQKTIDQTSKYILKEMERHGMLPPNQYSCTNEFRFEWESEDDK